MSNHISPLFAVFSKHLDISVRMANAGDHQQELVHMLIAAYAAAAAGTKDSIASSYMLLHVDIPKCQEKHNINMDGVEMPDGWNEELLAAISAEQAAKSADAQLANLVGQPLQ